MSVGAEIHAGCDSREGTSFPLTQPAVASCLLVFDLTEKKRQEKLRCDRNQHLCRAENRDFGINRWRDNKKTRFNVSCLVLEGLGSQSFVERCKVSGQTLKMVFYLLLLKDKIGEFPQNSWFKFCLQMWL